MAAATATAAPLQQQLQAIAAAANAAAAPASGGMQLAPDAKIAAIGGASLPLYAFAADPAAPPPRMGGGAAAAGGAANGASAAAAGAPGEDGAPEFGFDCVPAGRILRGAQPPTAPGRSLLDGLVLAAWADAEAKGLLRYDIMACPTKVLPGDFGFIAQLNEGRATKKRPTEFKLDEVCQPFDPAKFNFTKAAVSEVLFAFQPASGATTSSASTFSTAAPAGPSPSAVLVNVSPIDYGHVLLCPRLLDGLPQQLDLASVKLALRYAREAGSPYVRVGYNSLGAYATINHLHFQSYYLNTPMPIERSPIGPIPSLPPRADGVRVGRLTNYPVRAFVIEGSDLDAVAGVVTAAVTALQGANVPHNMLISASGGRVFLAPQCYAEKQAQGVVPEHLLATGVNPAVWEITGHMVLFRPDDYDAFTQELAWELLAEISVPEERFLALADLCFGSGAAGAAPAAAAAAAAAN